MSIKKTMDNLQARRFQVHYFETGAEAAAFLNEELNDTQIGIGGSTTIDSLGLYELLQENNEVYWHWKSSAPDILSKANCAPVYLTSANAIAESGEIVNIDGRGNRLSSMVFGDGKRVIIVAGTNKICADLDSAIERARQTAATKNAQRFPVDTPCKHDGKCHDCRSPQRICNALLVLWGPMNNMESVDVVLIDEELGY